VNKRTRKIPVSPRKVIWLIMSNRFRLDLTLIGFGLWLFVFAPFPKSPVFIEMEKIANESTWGLLFFILGLLGFSTSIFNYNVRTRNSEVAKLFGIIVVASGWFLIWLLFTLSNFPSTSSYIYFVPVVESILIFLDATRIICWRDSIILEKIDVI